MISHRLSHFLKDLSDFSASDHAKLTLVATNLKVAGSVFLHHAHKLQVVRYDNQLQVLPLVQFHQPPQLVRQIDDMLSIQICGRLIESEDPRAVGKNFSES